MNTHETLTDLEVSQEEFSNILLRVPTALKRRLKVDAAMRGISMRSIILQALSEFGYDIPLEERKAKRKTRTHARTSKHSAFEDATISDYCTEL